MPRHGQPWDTRLKSPRPEFHPFQEFLAPLAALPEFPGPSELTELAEASRRRRAPELGALRFVAVRPKPKRYRRKVVDLEQLYDASIALKGEVPCYPQSYHDLFNALMFAAFPRAKRVLHERQYRALLAWALPGEKSLPPKRTREQDALTLMDEGGSVVVCTASALRRIERQTSLPLDGGEPGVELVVFGHALLEHLAEGNPALRSSARLFCVSQLPAPERRLALVDDFLHALLLNPARFAEPDADAVVEWQPEAPPLVRLV